MASRKFYVIFNVLLYLYSCIICNTCFYLVLSRYVRIIKLLWFSLFLETTNFCHGGGNGHIVRFGSCGWYYSYYKKVFNVFVDKFLIEKDTRKLEYLACSNKHSYMN